MLDGISVIGAHVKEQSLYFDLCKAFNYLRETRIRIRPSKMNKKKQVRIVLIVAHNKDQSLLFDLLEAFDYLRDTCIRIGSSKNT